MKSSRAQTSHYSSTSSGVSRYLQGLKISAISAMKIFKTLQINKPSNYQGALFKQHIKKHKTGIWNGFKIF